MLGLGIEGALRLSVPEPSCGSPPCLSRTRGLLGEGPCAMAEYCARCKRRMVVAYHLSDEVKRHVLLNRWKSGVCVGCFDKPAEKGGIAFSFQDVSATSWSDRPLPRNPYKRKR